MPSNPAAVLCPIRTGSVLDHGAQQREPPGRYRWWWAAVTLIGSATVFRLTYLAYLCPLDLAPDEAHYWDWSRHLDWSYYSKGPLVAYLIRAGCLLAGPLSRWLIGNEMIAVRLPAVICGGLLLTSLYTLTLQVYRSEKLALSVVGVALVFPVTSAGALLMTIDAPYTCCWGWALVAGYHAVFRQASWAWPTTGLLIGLGILAKYTMILWVPSLALFLLATPGCSRLLFRPGFWIMSTVGALCCLPVLIWNAQHDWVTFRHLEGHAGLQGESTIRWFGPFTFIGGQFGLLLGYFFVVWVAALIGHRPWRESRPQIAYLWWMSLPMFVFFLLFSLKNGGGELNWPVTAYLSGMVLAAGWMAESLSRAKRLRRVITLALLLVFSCLSLGVTVLIHNSALVRPVLDLVSGSPTPERPFPLRRFDPTCRLKGWRTLAAAVDRLRAQESSAAGEVMVAGCGWDMPGIISFYCTEQPSVYSLDLVTGGRHNQYDFWHPNPFSDASYFLGKTFVMVNCAQEAVRQGFDRLEPPILVTHFEDGQPIAQWRIVIGHGYKGFPVNITRCGY